MNKKLLVLLFVISLFSCKSVSELTDYGVNKNDEYFSIAVLPDTQYYTAMRYGGTMSMFQEQINWILKNYRKEKIAYIIHLGDLTDHNAPAEWERATETMYKLDKTGVPYGVAVGNHDQSPNGTPSMGADTTQFTRYLGKTHFGNRSWYGGALGNGDNNDTHFDVFTANGEKYLVMYFVFNQPNYKGYSETYEKQMLNWADSVLLANADRKAILVSHSTLGKPKGSTSGDKPGGGNRNLQSNFTGQGKAIYEMAKHHENVFLMLGGHIAGEGYRKDEYNGNVIKTYLSDYQSRQSAPYSGTKDRNGGNGSMRLMRLNKTKQTLSVLTFIPKPNGTIVKETDGDSQFTDALYK